MPVQEFSEIVPAVSDYRSDRRSRIDLSPDTRRMSDICRVFEDHPKHFQSEPRLLQIQGHHLRSSFCLSSRLSLSAGQAPFRISENQRFSSVFLLYCPSYISSPTAPPPGMSAFVSSSISLYDKALSFGNLFFPAIFIFFDKLQEYLFIQHHVVRVVL